MHKRNTLFKRWNFFIDPELAVSIVTGVGAGVGNLRGPGCVGWIVVFFRLQLGLDDGAWLLEGCRDGCDECDGANDNDGLNDGFIVTVDGSRDLEG